MNREDIIRMARDAGGFCTTFSGRFTCDQEGLERFAAMAFQAGAAAEREAISDEYASRLQSDLENGVRFLNERAASEFSKKYPQLASFNEWLIERGGE